MTQQTTSEHYLPPTQDRAFSGFTVQTGAEAFPAEYALLAWYQSRLGSRVLQAWGEG